MSRDSLCWLAVGTALVVPILSCGPLQGPTASQEASALPASAAKVDFQCRLPVFRLDYGAGFVQFPKGDYSADRSARVSKFLTYESSLGRWLPVGQQAVSPDRTSYAVSTATAVRVVDLGTGESREVLSGEGVYNVIAYTLDGIYISRGSPSLPSEIWIVQPGNPSSRRLDIKGGIPPTDVLSWVGTGGGVWARSLSRTSLLRIDLEERTVTTWLSTSGASVSILGFDGRDHPVVWMDGSERKVVVVSAPGETATIYKADNPAFQPLNALGDKHGIWFGNLIEDASVWLFTPDGNLRKVAEIPRLAGSAPGERSTRIAGPCV